VTIIHRVTHSCRPHDHMSNVYSRLLQLHQGDLSAWQEKIVYERTLFIVWRSQFIHTTKLFGLCKLSTCCL